MTFVLSFRLIVLLHPSAKRPAEYVMRLTGVPMFSTIPSAMILMLAPLFKRANMTFVRPAVWLSYVILTLSAHSSFFVWQRPSSKRGLHPRVLSRCVCLFSHKEQDRCHTLREGYNMGSTFVPLIALVGASSTSPRGQRYGLHVFPQGR